MRPIPFWPPAVVLVGLFASVSPAADEYKLHSFARQQLTSEYYSEGANAGDINGDGKVDVVSGPYWYEGPDFKTKHEFYPAKPQNREVFYGRAEAFLAEHLGGRVQESS